MGVFLKTYYSELKRTMEHLARNEKTVFLGQGVLYGDGIYRTLLDIPSNKKIEMPIAEDMQMGISIGLSLEGYIPICIYQRMDFLILSMNQLINHLDKIQDMSKNEFMPKVLIRCIIGSKSPLNPGLQHCQDYTDAIKQFVTNVDIIKLTSVDDIYKSYKKAFKSNKSTILIELKELYETE